MKKTAMMKKLAAAGAVLAITLLCACGDKPEGTDEAGGGQELSAASGDTQNTPPVEDEQSKRAEECYEQGRAYLYGLNGTAISYASARECFEEALSLGKQDANFYLGALYDWYGYPERDFEKASACYAACPDNPYAQVSLGFNYYYGLGVEADTGKALQLFQTAIDSGYAEGYLGLAYVERAQGNYEKAVEYYRLVLDGSEPYYLAKAMCEIANCYNRGLGVEQDYGKVLEWYEKADELGDPSAAVSIGFLYSEGRGVEQDSGKAIEWFEKAAKAGDSYALNYIGFLYLYGRGVEQDYGKALEWFEKAAEAGNDEGMYQIGFLYLNGQGVEQDYGKALEWCEKAAERGHRSAMLDAGRIYYDGEGVEQDYGKALEWFEKAAESGDDSAMFYVGRIYYEGQGVEQDYKKALEWYEKAADLENWNAMNEIGCMYRDGMGVEQDYTKAMEWFEKAVRLGNYTSMKNIGDMYENGMGVEQDHRKATEWYKRAGATGP